jgi:hypothetical protein
LNEFDCELLRSFGEGTPAFPKRRDRAIASQPEAKGSTLGGDPVDAGAGEGVAG